MTTNESPRVKSAAISVAVVGLAGGVSGVVATGRLDARSGGDTVARRASVASFAIDPTAGAPVLEAAPAALPITSLTADTELSDGLAFSGVTSSCAMDLWARAGAGKADAAEGGRSTSAGTA